MLMLMIVMGEMTKVCLWMFDRVVPGFGRDDCIPFSADETEYQIQWKGDPQDADGSKEGGLEQRMVSQMRGGLKVKVYLDRARLFAIYAAQ